jgi:hypothetical protein
MGEFGVGVEFSEEFFTAVELQRDEVLNWRMRASTISTILCIFFNIFLFI